MKFPRPAAFLLLAQSAVLAQAPPPAAPKNAIRNGGFERTLQAPNLWSGVDKDGFLAGFRGSLPVLNESGSVTETPVPVGVAVADLNADALPDILSSDPLGFVRIYFNSGSKDKPKFTAGELSLPWLASGEGDPTWRPIGVSDYWAKRRFGVRASLSPSPAVAGKFDLVAGNYFGDIFIVRNTGSPQSPQFPQPQPLAKAIVATSKDPAHRWGNVFAPLLHDWDADGKPDLLVGEGSYSANNVHLFLNQGSAASPVFNEQKRQPLALGEGRQQLTPALADVNGNGKLDILVTDRSGRLTAYLRPDNWQWGESIAPAGFLAKNGGLTSDNNQALVLGSGIHTIATGDLNGDGLFDLVVGKTNGRLAWSTNQGSKESPKFAPPADLTGDKPVPPAWQVPSQWDVDTGTTRGNFFAYANGVTAQEDPNAQPVEGTRALKFGYATPDNKLLPRISLTFPASPEFDRRGGRSNAGAVLSRSAEQRGIGTPSNFFILRQPVELEIGKNYKLSFQAKGNKVGNASYVLAWRNSKQLGEERVVRGERGAVKVQRNVIDDSNQLSADFRPGGNWTAVSKSCKIEYKNERDLNKEKLTSEAILEISFDLGAPDGFLYLDDLKLVPEG